MARRILFIINPIAGTRSKRHLPVLIEQACRKVEIPFDIMDSPKDGNYSGIRTRIQQDGITDVAIAGGDGTLSAVIGALRDLPLQFGIIPVGSGNGLARAARIPMNPTKAMSLIIIGRAALIDAFTVNGRFACMLSGLGFDAAVAAGFAEMGQRGLINYIRQVVRHFRKAPVYSFQLNWDSHTLDTKGYFISVANSNQFGNGFTIAPKASLNDGLLDVVLVREQPKRRLIPRVIKQVIGWNRLQEDFSLSPSKKIVYLQTKQISIQNTDQALLHIDGDPAPTSELIQMEIIREAFSLIRPVGRMNKRTLFGLKIED
ncbi:MAG: diacylglycerol/lipid kinase family protein [Bacteroidota bacterium]